MLKRSCWAALHDRRTRLICSPHRHFFRLCEFSIHARSVAIRRAILSQSELVFRSTLHDFASIHAPSHLHCCSEYLAPVVQPSGGRQMGWHRNQRMDDDTISSSLSGCLFRPGFRGGDGVDELRRNRR